MSQFLILIPGGLGFTTPFSLDPPSRTNFQCHQQATANSIDKTQISDFCWLTAFIQKLWKTAWDLLAHRNIEILGSGFGTPNLLHCCPWPKIPFIYPRLDTPHITPVSIRWLRPWFMSTYILAIPLAQSSRNARWIPIILHLGAIQRKARQHKTPIGIDFFKSIIIELFIYLLCCFPSIVKVHLIPFVLA